MIKQTETAQALADLLDQYQEKIVIAWADKVFHVAGFRPGNSRPELFTMFTEELKAITTALASGSYASLITYLSNRNLASIQAGYESSEVIEAMLLCKDAVLPVIRQVYSSDFDKACAMISELDKCLRWMVGYLNTSYVAEMNHRLREQHERLAQMLKLTQKNLGHIELDEILQQVAKGIVTAAASDHCNFYMVSEDQSRLIARRGVGNSPPLESSFQHFLDHEPDPKTDIFLKHVLEHKEPLASHDAQSDPRVNQDIIGPMGNKSILAVPLVVHDRVLAVAMTGTFYNYRTFTTEQIELAWNIARVGALVIENERMHEERQSENQSIQRVSNALLQELEIKEILKVICTEAQQLTGASGSAIYFLENNDELRYVYNTGEKPYLETIPIEGSLAERVLREGKPLVSNRASDDKRLIFPQPSVKSLMVAPLRSNNSMIGALYAVNKPWGFTKNDIRIIGLFADQAAIAIENARLHEQTRQMAALEERERLAREIHDNLAQVLSVLKLHASQVGDLLRGENYEQAQICLDNMKKMATEAHADARDAIFSLRSSAASPSELLSTLHDLLERYRNVYKLDTQLVVEDESLISLSPSAAIQLTRIIQEAFTNIRKHAQASVVEMRLEQTEGYLCAIIEDNGQGFDPAELEREGCQCEGVGLQIMRERADSLGGHLEMVSHPGQGTRIVVRIPLSDRS